MDKLKRVLAGLAIAGAAVVAVPTVAQADGGCGQGNFCAYSDEYNHLYQNGGNSGDWPYQVKNKVDWVHNNGYAGGRDHVNIYYNEWNKGAYACIGYGTAWNLRGNSQKFNWTRDNDTDGQWKPVHDLAASHRWVTGCGNGTW
uniref:Peptidase inhibitor family I36 n=1 Tax=Streptomyces sp. NBC_00049 TaxID=2903617 RepID=A0AAU2JM41_9ACTN